MILSNPVLFYSQITPAINKIEKSNFNFYGILEYVNFFCLKTFPLQKKTAGEHQFRENEAAYECCP